MIKLLVVDDQDVIYQGVTNYFDNHDTIQLVDTASSGFDALEKLKRLDVDVVVLDIGMPQMNGIECCRLIKKFDSDIKVLAYTSSTDTQEYYDIFVENANGIALKVNGLKELSIGIQNVYNGFTFLASNLGFFFNKGKRVTSEPKLSKREMQVINLLVLNYKRKDAAEKLCISIDTLNTHCKHIFKKLGIHSVSNLIEKAKEKKLT